MIAQSNGTHMLVGKDLDILGNTASRADLAIGQIGVFLVGSVTANGAGVLADGARYTIATKNQDGVIIETPIVTAGKETSKEDVDYTASTVEAKAVGYNGTSGSIDVVNTNNYVMHIFWNGSQKSLGGNAQLVKFAAYKSSSAATQIEIATGLAANFNKNFAAEDPKLMKAEIVSAAAGAAMTGTGTLTVKNNSKYVVAGTDADAVLVVNDYVRIGGTATTNVVYKVVAIDTANDIITLNMPYQGADEVVAEAATEVVTAAAGAAADAGVKLSALDSQKYFEPGLVVYDKLFFKVELKEEFGATDISVLSVGKKGSGTYYEVSQNEWFLKGNRGETWRQGNYPKAVKLEATAGKTYDQISIGLAEANSKTIDRQVLAFNNILIATEVSAGGNVYASLKTALGL